MNIPAPIYLTRPFNPTHTRSKDGLAVQLLGQHDNRVVYRVKFGDVDRLTSTSAAHFERTFNA